MSDVVESFATPSTPYGSFARSSLDAWKVLRCSGIAGISSPVQLQQLEVCIHTWLALFASPLAQPLLHDDHRDLGAAVGD